MKKLYFGMIVMGGFLVVSSLISMATTAVHPGEFYTFTDAIVCM